MKINKNFVFDTPITELYGSNIGEVLGYARISGIGYWRPDMQQDFDDSECDLEDIADFDIENVRIKVGIQEEGAYLSYRVAKKLGDTFADIIDKATLAHMQYLFSDDYGKNEIPEAEHTDVTQVGYAVSYIVESPKDNTQKEAA